MPKPDRRGDTGGPDRRGGAAGPDRRGGGVVPPEARNILFVTLDEVRADVAAGRLAGIATTPTFDRLAAKGMRFDQ